MGPPSASLPSEFMVDDLNTPDPPEEPAPVEPVEDPPVETGWFEKGGKDPEEPPVEDTTVPMEWLEEGEEQ